MPDVTPGSESRAKRARRRTFLQVREAARAERDIEIADYLDGYADQVEAGLALTREPEVTGLLATALRGLGSSVRAGVID